MNYLDWTVILVYVAGLIWLSYHLSNGQTDATDYYLGGNSFSWERTGGWILANGSRRIFLYAPYYGCDQSQVQRILLHYFTVIVPFRVSLVWFV